jgi:transcriptional regulator with XRE-family HTH domain
VDVSLVIKQRLAELGFEQQDLADAAQVTESYISQILTRKKAPPAPSRTDIYEKMGEFLKLPNGELAKLANLQREAELKRKLADPATALFKEVRELVLRKCKPDKQSEISAIFSKQPFGELERLVTQKLLDVVRELPERSWKARTGFTWWRDSAIAASKK